MNQAKDYLPALLSWQDEPVIKAVTGMPGSGKTKLLTAFREHLRSIGVSDDRIVSINFSVIKHLPDYRILLSSIKERLSATDTTYILVDDVQLVSGFEKVLASLLVKPKVDIYMSGERSQLLSGEDATLLSGRFVEIRVDA